MNQRFRTGPARSLAFVTLLGLTAPLAGQDFPQWRGPQRDGRVSSFDIPQTWPARLTRVWSIDVGLGHASPIVVGDRVWLFAREDGDEVLGSYELATGRAASRAGYPAPYQMHEAAVDHGPGPKSTPVSAGGMVVTLGISGILSGHSAEGGSRAWQRRFDDAFESTSPTYGAAMSPLVEDGRVIAHVGGSGDGALGAFDLATGKTIWMWRGDGPGYASPIVADVDGVRQVITQSEQHVIGVDFETGSELWKIPLKTPYSQNSVTSVVAGDRLYYSGLDQGLHAVRLSRAAGSWGAEPIWSLRDVSLYMSSPVLDDGVLFGLSHLRKGQLFAVDAATGKVTWKSPGRQAENAAVLWVGGAWLVLTDAGELEVLERQGDRFVTLASYDVADTPTWAHPALSGDLILVKARSSLSAWRVH